MTKKKGANDNGIQSATAGLQSRTVGYGKPPKESQFQKGVSGNPKGRPKGRQSLASLTDVVFEEKVAVMKHGKLKKVPFMQGMLLKIAAMAMSGDHHAQKTLFALYESANLARNDNQLLSVGSSFELTPQDLDAISKSGLFKKT